MREKVGVEPEKMSKVAISLWGSELIVDAVVDSESGRISRIGDRPTVFSPAVAPQALHFDYQGFYEDQLSKIEQFFKSKGVVIIDSRASYSEDGDDFAGYVEISQGSLNDALQNGKIILTKNTQGEYLFEGLPNE